MIGASRGFGVALRRPRHSHGALTLVMAWLAMPMLACSAKETQQTARVVQQSCPQLVAEIDPLALTYSADPQTNVKLRSFVAAGRGLSDAAKKMETLANNSCWAMARDMGLAPETAQHPVTAATACEAVGGEIDRLKAAGVVFSITLSEPSCSLDVRRKQECELQCTDRDATCLAGCAVRGEVYAQCTLPHVAVALSSPSERGTLVARALQAHLPRLTYAQVALGKRLLTHVQSMARAGANLPSIEKSGLLGTACIVASVAAAADAGTRIASVLEQSAAVTRHLVM